MLKLRESLQFKTSLLCAGQDTLPFMLNNIGVLAGNNCLSLNAKTEKIKKLVQRIFKLFPLGKIKKFIKEGESQQYATVLWADLPQMSLW